MAAVLGCLALLAVNACSGPEDNERPSLRGATLSAGAVCAGTLAEARQDLEEMMDGERFREEGAPVESLSAYLEELTEPETFQVAFCDITSDARVSIHMEFGWESRLESSEPSSSVSRPFIAYAAGIEAYAYDSMSFMYMECPSPDGQEYPGAALRATLGTGPDEMDPDLRMSVLAAAARDVAEGLGCLEEAGLPEGAPERVEEEPGA